MVEAVCQDLAPAMAAEGTQLYTRTPLAHQQAIVFVMLTTSLPPLDRARELPIAGFLNQPLTQEKVTGLLQQHFAR